jgi:hypothetical protein
MARNWLIAAVAAVVGFAAGYGVHWRIYSQAETSMMTKVQQAEELYHRASGTGGLPFTEEQVKAAIQSTYTLKPETVHYQTLTGERTQWFEIPSTTIQIEVIGDPSSPHHVGVIFPVESSAITHAKIAIKAIESLLPATRVSPDLAIEQALRHIELDDVGAIGEGGAVAVELTDFIALEVRKYPSNKSAAGRRKVSFVAHR